MMVAGAACGGKAGLVNEKFYYRRTSAAKWRWNGNLLGICDEVGESDLTAILARDPGPWYVFVKRAQRR